MLKRWIFEVTGDCRHRNGSWNRDWGEHLRCIRRRPVAGQMLSIQMGYSLVNILDPDT